MTLFFGRYVTCHHASEGKDHWHGVGPNIHNDLPRDPTAQPEAFREFIAEGKIHIKDFKLHGEIYGVITTKGGTRYISPNSLDGEIVVQKFTGDVHVDLVLRLKWRNDRSVSLNLKAGRFDESDLVDGLYKHNLTSLKMNL